MKISLLLRLALSLLFISQVARADSNTDHDEGHVVCENKRCISVPGSGDDECGDDSNCNETHMICFSSDDSGGAPTCMPQEGPGEDECGPDSPCSTSSSSSSSSQSSAGSSSSAQSSSANSSQSSSASSTPSSSSSSSSQSSSSSSSKSSSSSSSSSSNSSSNSSSGNPGGPNDPPANGLCDSVSGMCVHSPNANTIPGQTCGSDDECGYWRCGDSECKKTPNYESAKFNNVLSTCDPKSKFNKCSHLTCSITGQCVYDPTGSGPSCINSTDCQHKVCSNGQCISIRGSGTSQCADDKFCSSTHYECRGTQCTEVPLGGIDTCGGNDTPGGDCRHYGCSDGKCVALPGEGQDTCQYDSSCGELGSASTSTSPATQSALFSSALNKKTQGSAKAPAVLRMFQDLSCGMCKLAHGQVINPLLEKYAASGALRIEIIEFPLGQAIQESNYAKIGICADKAGKYGSFLNVRFNEKDTQSNLVTVYSDLLKINKNTLQKCYASSSTAAQLKSEIKRGKILGITGTPTFTLNNKIISSVEPVSFFIQQIDAISSKKNRK